MDNKDVFEHALMSLKLEHIPTPGLLLHTTEAMTTVCKHWIYCLWFSKLDNAQRFKLSDMEQASLWETWVTNYIFSNEDKESLHKYLDKYYLETANLIEDLCEEAQLGNV